MFNTNSKTWEQDKVGLNWPISGEIFVVTIEEAIVRGNNLSPGIKVPSIKLTIYIYKLYVTCSQNVRKLGKLDFA